MEEDQDQISPRLKLIILERDKDKVKQAHGKTEKSVAYIFTPKNDMEEIAIAIATEGDSGWKDSLYSLNYVDLYLEHTCFIFATRPESSKDQQWLLVNLDAKSGRSYWIALGEKQLSEVYYAWAKVVKKNNAHFEPQYLLTNRPK